MLLATTTVTITSTTRELVSPFDDRLASVPHELGLPSCRIDRCDDERTAEAGRRTSSAKASLWALLCDIRAESIWGFDYNFTNYNFRTKLKRNVLPEVWNSRVFSKCYVLINS